MTAAAPMGLHQLQEALLDLIAPEGWRDMGITEATLDLRAREWPRLTLRVDARVHDHNLRDGRFDAAAGALLRRFELVPLDPPATTAPAPDLDHMARLAREGLHRAIHKSVETHLWELQQDAQARRDAAQLRYLDAVKEHRADVVKRALQPWLRQVVGHLAADLQRRSVASGAGVINLPGGLFGSGLATLAQMEPPKRTLRRRVVDLYRRVRAAVVVAVAGGIAMAIALGWLGPALDAQPDRRAEWLQAEEELQATGALHRWEAEARRRCGELTGENGSYVQVDGGAIVCTDKRGRRAPGGQL